MTTYYHVTYSAWDGEDLRSYNAMIEDGEMVKWKWDEAEPGLDGDRVSLHGDLDDAIAFRDTYCPDGEILRVDVPDDDYDRERLDIVVRRNSEGYDSILGHIPAEIISRV